MSKYVFYSNSFSRPIRLSEKTRGFARRALDGELGNGIKLTDHLVLNKDICDTLSSEECYAECAWQIARKAPIKIYNDELFVGSATLHLSKAHMVPVLFEGADNARLYTVSHTTCGYERAIKIGYKGLRALIAESMEKYKDNTEKIRYLGSCLKCLNAAKLWHERYIHTLTRQISLSQGEEKERLEEIRSNLFDVPENPPENFRQAVQSLWFMFCFQRLCGNWPAIGRIDQILFPYLKKDLDEKKITLNEAREYIAHFWIKGCEWVTHETHAGNRWGSGDGQNYQNVVLSGTDENGKDMTNSVTYLVLDVIEELGIADFPISVRLHENMPGEFFKRVARVIRYGGGAIAVYNDKTVIDALVKFGYPLSEAVKYANDGCWEVQIPGKTCFGYWAFDILSMLHNGVLFLRDGKPSALNYKNIDDIISALKDVICNVLKKYIESATCTRSFNPKINPHKKQEKAPLVSLFIEGCIEKGLDYRDDGPKYLVCSPHVGGLADVAGALQAINYVVFEKKLMTLNEFMDIVKSNWENHEDLRLLIKNHITYFGNGEKESDSMMQRVFDLYIDCVNSVKSKNPQLRFPAGLSTFARQVTAEFLDNRGANPDGHLKGDFLANNANPTPGADKKGATALLRSLGGLDMSKLPGGCAFTVRFLQKTVAGEEGLNALADYLYAFCRLGGHFMQCDIADADILRKAQENPEQYEDLQVRVSGWNARFNTLSRDWQEMIIQESLEGK